MKNLVIGGLHRHRSRTAMVVIAAAILCLTGCRKSGPDVQMVEGLVTIDGEPLAAATVGFSPLIPGEGLPATGATLADGRFRLTATRGGATEKGTTVGEYAVSISKVELLPDPKWDNLKPGEMPSGPREIRYRYLVPKAYESTTTSGLKTTVKKGLNTGEAFTFELKSDYKPE